MSEPAKFIFHFPEGEKKSDDMTREELLRVIEWQRQEIERQRESHKTTLDILGNRFRL